MNTEDAMSRGDAKYFIRNRLKRNLTLFLFKHIFGSAAHWADPSVGKFIKGCARRDITVRIALFGIVNITANLAFPFFHLSLLCELGINHSTPGLPSTSLRMVSCQPKPGSVDTGGDLTRYKSGAPRNQRRQRA